MLMEAFLGYMREKSAANCISSGVLEQKKRLRLGKRWLCFSIRRCMRVCNRKLFPFSRFLANQEGDKERRVRNNNEVLESLCEMAGGALEGL